MAEAPHSGTVAPGGQPGPAAAPEVVTGPELVQLLTSRVVDVPDWPQPGVMFKDITPLLADPVAFRSAIAAMVRTAPEPFDLVAGIEARGFMLAAAVAYAAGVGVVPVRKAGKLPRATHAASTPWSTAKPPWRCIGTGSRPTRGCWWWTTCWPPAVPPGPPWS